MLAVFIFFDEVGDFLQSADFRPVGRGHETEFPFVTKKIDQPLAVDQQHEGIGGLQFADNQGQGRADTLVLNTPGGATFERVCAKAERAVDAEADQTHQRQADQEFKQGKATGVSHV